MWHRLFILVAVIVVLFLAAVGEAVIEALLDYQEKQRAKVEMFWCSKPGHGMFPKEHCVALFDTMTTDDGRNVVVCPICYREACFVNPEKRLRAS